MNKSDCIVKQTCQECGEVYLANLTAVILQYGMGLQNCDEHDNSKRKGDE